MLGYRTVMALTAIAQEDFGRVNHTRYRKVSLEGIREVGKGCMEVRLQGGHTTIVRPSDLARRKASDAAVRAEECERVLTYLLERGRLRQDEVIDQLIELGVHRGTD